jgi:arylsulfatase A-like enzyme
VARASHNHTAVRKFISRSLWLFLALHPAMLFGAGKAEHIVLVVWDGMRPDFITQEHTPTLFQLARDGVMFQNHHPVYCSATEVNGTALATGAYPEHSGVIANTDYRPQIDPLKPVGIEVFSVVRRGDEVSGGQYLLRPTLAELLQATGKKTVIAGTKPVAVLHDRRERREGATSVTLFDGRSLPPIVATNIRSQSGNFPASASTNSLLPNEPRDQWTTRALTESLWSNGVPAYTLLWLSEPDFSQHASGPGSVKSLAALESCDRKLADVLAALKQRGVRDRTDVFVVSDHGFSTIEKSVDIVKELRAANFPAFKTFRVPPKKGDILAVSQGGSVLFYIIGDDLQATRKLVEFLQRQEFAGVLFTREAMEGTFTLDQAKIRSPQPPNVVMSMRWSAEKSRTGAPGMFISEGTRPPGDGMHGSLCRFDMHNTLVGAGPDLKTGFNDGLPTGNTDLAPTILWLLGVKATELMDGRVLSEALTVDAPAVNPLPPRRLETHRVSGGRVVWTQYLQISQVNGTIYLDEGNASGAAK